MSETETEYIEKIRILVNKSKYALNEQLSESERMSLYKSIRCSIIRAPNEISELACVFACFDRNADLLIRNDWRVLADILILFTCTSSSISPSLLQYIKIAAEMIEKKAAISNADEQICILLFLLHMYIIILEEEEEDCVAEKIEKIMEKISQALGLSWRFIGTEARMYKEQKETVPVVACVIERDNNIHKNTEEDIEEKIKTDKSISNNYLTLLEENIGSCDRYYIFPKENRQIKYYLSSQEIELMCLVARYMLATYPKSPISYVSAICRAILSQKYVSDALIIYSQTLQDRPTVKVSLLEYVIYGEQAFWCEQRRELLLANAYVESSLYDQACTLFEKHGSTSKLIESLCLAGKKDAAVPLLQKKISDIEEKLAEYNLANKISYVFSGTESVSDPMHLLKIELGSLLFMLGKIQNDTPTLRKAFETVKILKHAKTLCAHLLLEEKTSEAVQVLKECPFEVLDKEAILLHIASAIQQKRFADAEQLIRCAFAFGNVDERLDFSFQAVLIQQGKMDELLQFLDEKIKRSTNALQDCSALFSLGHAAKNYRYCNRAIMHLYKRIGKTSLQWIETLVALASESKDAKQSVLEALSQMKTLDMVPYIRTALLQPPEISAEVEYTARKRLIEYAIKNRRYDEGKQNLDIMEKLAQRIGMQQDFLDTAQTFFSR